MFLVSNEQGGFIYNMPGHQLYNGIGSQFVTYCHAPTSTEWSINRLPNLPKANIFHVCVHSLVQDQH